jgi:hypothetical protein
LGASSPIPCCARWSGATAGKSQIRILSFDGGADRWLSVTPVNKIVCLHEPEIASVTDAMFSVQ